MNEEDLREEARKLDRLEESERRRRLEEKYYADVINRLECVLVDVVYLSGQAAKLAEVPGEALEFIDIMKESIRAKFSVGKIMRNNTERTRCILPR